MKAQDTLTDSIKETAKAKQRLAGIDEINPLSDDSETGTAAGTSSGVTGGVFDDTAMPEYQVKEPDISWVDGFKTKFEGFKSLFDFSGIQQSWANLKAALTPLGENIGSGLKWLWDNILVPFSTWTVNSAVPAFLDVLAGGAKVLNSVIEALKPLGQWLWDKFLQPFASWTGGVVVDILKGTADALTQVSDWINNNQELVRGMTVTVGLFFAAWKATELLAFLQMSGGVVGAFKAITAAIKAGTLAKITDKAETIALTAMYAKDLIVSLAKGTAELAKQAGQWVILTGAKVADAVKTGVQTAATWLATAAQGALNLVMSMNPIALVVIAIAALVAAFVVLWNKCEGFRNFFIGLWDSIKSGFVGFVNFIIRGINMLIKNFLLPLNLLIKGWNATVGQVTAKIPEIRISIPEIPSFADGGMLYGDTILRGGEYSGAAVNPEVISPLDKLEAMITKAVQSAGSSGGGDIIFDMPVYLDPSGGFIGTLRAAFKREDQKSGKPLTVI